MFQFIQKPASAVYETNYSYRKPNGTPEFLYRYEASFASPDDGTSDQAYLITFNVIRQTPKCYVICRFGNDKFVLKDARKRYAYPDLKDALNSFKIRCNWRMRYAKRDLDYAERALDLVKVIENE